MGDTPSIPLAPTPFRLWSPAPLLAEISAVVRILQDESACPLCCGERQGVQQSCLPDGCPSPGVLFLCGSPTFTSCHLRPSPHPIPLLQRGLPGSPVSIPGAMILSFLLLGKVWIHPGLVLPPLLFIPYIHCITRHFLVHKSHLRLVIFHLHQASGFLH